MEKGVRVLLSPTGEGLAVEMPTGHTVSVPTNEKGMRFIFQVLLEQERYSGPHTVGTPAAPTQDMVDTFLRKGGKVKQYDSAGEEKREVLTLKDLGLE